MLRAILPRSGRVALALHYPVRVSVYDGPTAAAPSSSEVLVHVANAGGLDLEQVLAVRTVGDTLHIGTSLLQAPALTITVFVPPMCDLHVEQPMDAAPNAITTLSQLYGRIDVASRAGVHLDRMHPARLAVRCDGSVTAGSVEGPLDIASLAGGVRMRKIQSDNAVIAGSGDVVLRALYGTSYVHGRDVTIGATHGTTNVTAGNDLFIGSINGTVAARADGNATTWLSSACSGSIAVKKHLQLGYAPGSFNTTSMPVAGGAGTASRWTVAGSNNATIDVQAETFTLTPLSWFDAATRAAAHLGAEK